MDLSKSNISLTKNEQSLIKMLLYYDVFDHPLTKDELNNSFNSNSGASMEENLSRLSELNMIDSVDGYYYLSGKRNLVNERREEELALGKYLRIARLMTKIIASCPFVKGVSLSGSISKGRIYKRSDIDFFIIAEKGKLYISRTLLTLFKKIFLFNSYKYFCLNYFVDTASLEFKNQNRYAATETITLIPTYNDPLFDQLIAANKWVEALFPSFKRKDSRYVIPNRIRPLKWIFEFLLRNSFGNWIDNFLMKQTDKYRRRKFAFMQIENYDHSFQTSKSVSRHHPDNFHNNAMINFIRKLEEFERSWGVDLSKHEEL
ncbi:MAG: hypothetical protein ISR55_12130 [Bacteroidetes bacterium]|nr:hypothetical protein [Bacteroidota bacterium]